VIGHTYKQLWIFFYISDIISDLSSILSIMPVSKKSMKKTMKKTGKKNPNSSFLYNPMDPFNQYPNHETGEEEYGPIPLFGYNKHDPLNMQPFNPNAMSAMMGGPFVQPPHGALAIPMVLTP